MGIKTFVVVASGLFAAGLVWAAPRLSPIQKEEIRSGLQNLVDGAELMVRNRIADRRDLERQKSDFVNLKVYNRIPLSPDVDQLREEMKASALSSGLKLVSLTVLSSPSRPKPIPPFMYSDVRTFDLLPGQVVQEIPIRVEVEGGDREVVLAWMRSWKHEQMRFVEAKPGTQPKTKAGSAPQVRRWEVQALTYKFRDVRFPEIRFRDPLELLPAWARMDQISFAKKEPQLWSLVARSRELSPQARGLTDDRREFLLERARLEFYLSKAKGH